MAQGNWYQTCHLISALQVHGGENGDVDMDNAWYFVDGPEDGDIEIDLD